MLDREVVEACAAGKFHVFAVATIDEGITLLTGVPAGEQAADGRYPKDTINRRVEDKLTAFAEMRREFAASKPIA
jgi:hypothetical protein